MRLRAPVELLQKYCSCEPGGRRELADAPPGGVEVLQVDHGVVRHDADAEVVGLPAPVRVLVAGVLRAITSRN